MHWPVLVFAAEFVFGQKGTFFVLAIVILMLAAVGVAVFRGKVNLSGWLERIKNPRIRRRMSSFEVFFVEEVSEIFETALPSLIFGLFLGVWFSLVWAFVDGGGANIITSAQTLWSAMVKAWSHAELSGVLKELPLGLLAHKLIVYGFLTSQFYRVNAVNKTLLIVAGRILGKARSEGLRVGKIPFFTEPFEVFVGPQLFVLNFKEQPKDEDVGQEEEEPIEVVKKDERKEERFIGDLLVAIKHGEGDKEDKGDKEYADVEIAVQYYVADPRLYYAVRGSERDFMASFIATNVRAAAVKEHESLVKFFGMVFGELQEDVQNGLCAQLNSWGISVSALKIQEADSTAVVKEQEIKARAAAEEALGISIKGLAEARVIRRKKEADEQGAVSGFINGVLPENKQNDAELRKEIGLKFAAVRALTLAKPTIVMKGDSLLDAGAVALSTAVGVIASPSSSPPAQAS